MPNLIEKALAAIKETKRVEFKRTFDINSLANWCEIIKDIAALANSGGGIILVGVDNNGAPLGIDVSSVLALDPAVIADKLHAYTEVHFSDFEIIALTKDSVPTVAIRVGLAEIPLVFTKPGTYPVSENRQATSFGRGTVYLHIPEQIGRRSGANRPPFRTKSATPAG